VDRAPVRQRRHHESREISQGDHVVQRRCQRGAGFREEAQPALNPLHFVPGELDGAGALGLFLEPGHQDDRERYGHAEGQQAVGVRGRVAQDRAGLGEEVDGVHQSHQGADDSGPEPAAVGGVDRGEEQKRKRMRDGQIVPGQDIEENGRGQREQRPPNAGTDPRPMGTGSHPRNSTGHHCGPSHALRCSTLTHDCSGKTFKFKGKTL
jgi:hypothetical protein